jgi:hypothetical protein
VDYHRPEFFYIINIIKILISIQFIYNRSKMSEKNIDFESIFDKDLSLEEYKDKLRALLRENGVGIVDRRKIIRQKVQEFRDRTRRRDMRG